MFIQLDDYNFLNINHIVKTSVESNILRITFITGEQTSYFKQEEVNLILKQLKKYSNDSL